MPQLRAKADAVTADLKALTEIKAQALAEEATLKANYAVLEEEQLRIATLIAARKQGIGVRTRRAGSRGGRGRGAGRAGDDAQGADRQPVRRRSTSVSTAAPPPMRPSIRTRRC